MGDYNLTPSFEGLLQDVMSRLVALEVQSSGPRRFGSVACHYSASAVSDVTTVSHGLGSVPVAVFLTGQDSGTQVTAYALNSAPTATQFTFIGRDVQGTARGPGNLTVYWWAIG